MTDPTLDEILPHLEPEGLLHVKLAGARAIIASQAAVIAERDQTVADLLAENARLNP